MIGSTLAPIHWTPVAPLGPQLRILKIVSTYSQLSPEGKSPLVGNLGAVVGPQEMEDPLCQ